MLLKKLFSIIVFAGIFLNVFAQQDAPFYSDIQHFKKQDSLNPPPLHAILFVGSSSFTKWTDVQNYFPGYKIINRGFGGSSLPDVIRYANDIILPYHPKQVVIYCGDNDFAASDTVSTQTVISRFEKLFWIIRKGLPDANIVYVSIKPSPSRMKLMAKGEAANEAIKKFLATQKNTSFVDVFHLMLENGRPMPSIFLSDSLHMNASGYAIWKKAIEPELKSKSEPRF
ncbi:MAG: G-D-S-L family lipolytic protein [Bacteroidetes bacterium]|nr:G-D-S-L family lipolytic protein [Bacteroidota bacterium]